MFMEEGIFSHAVCGAVVCVDEEFYGYSGKHVVCGRRDGLWVCSKRGAYCASHILVVDMALPEDI